MKKRLWVVLAGALLIVMLSAPAMATTAIYVDGATYVFPGDQSTFEADGKTFVVGKDSIRIIEDGKPDRVLPLATAEDDSAGTADTTVAAGSASTATSADVSVCEGSGSVSVGTAEADCATSEDMSTRQGSGDTYSRYARFGLSYDAVEDTLYYQGKRVRVFEDTYSLNSNADTIGVIVTHFDELGTIDVEAQRTQMLTGGSTCAEGELTGLSMLSDSEFAARDLIQWTQGRYEITSASSGSPMTAAEAEAFYAPYAEFGLTCDAETDCLTYQGQTVHTFLDVKKTNGESFSSGNFQGSITTKTNDSGTIDVTTIRDYENSDEEGNGKLTGMTVEKVE